MNQNAWLKKIIEQYGPFEPDDGQPGILGGFVPDTRGYSYAESVKLCEQIVKELIDETGSISEIRDLLK